MNIVEVKPGLGTFVIGCKVDGNLIKELNENDGISLTEIFEARLILEPQLAKLAAKRATKEDFEIMEKFF